MNSQLHACRVFCLAITFSPSPDLRFLPFSIQGESQTAPLCLTLCVFAWGKDSRNNQMTNIGGIWRVN